MSKVVKTGYTTPAREGFNHRTAMEEAARCLLCHDAPCSEDCPAKTDPGKFIRSIRFRNPKGAADTIRENNILGSSCAWICPYDRLCEEACSRCGIDRPIEIGKLQQYAMEQEKVFGMELKAPEGKKKGKIACVGAGPASMACAAQLAKAGYKVTIFEREEKPGGVLSYGIAPSRLPASAVAQDIKQLKKLGVAIKLGAEVKDGDLDDYDAVFIGTGLWAPNIPDIPGKELKGVFAAVDYLKEARSKGQKFKPGKKVAVIGGGDVAVDCAVTAKLLGASDVKIVYRRTLEEAPGDMPEFQYALSLGIGITTGMAPAAMEGKKSVETVAFQGFRDKKAGMKLEADTVVFATGQKPEPPSNVAPVAVTPKGTIKATKTGKTNKAKYFAAGDIVNGGKTVVEAVAEGKDAADSIIAYLQKKGVK